MNLPVFDICELKNVIAEELELRKLSSSPGDYRHKRKSNTVPLYGCTGAANIYAELGFDFGGCKRRQEWADRINSFQNADGSFISPSGTEHAAATAICALNILGSAPRLPVRNLAPIHSEKLLEWLNSLNWNGTHKDFCSGVIPLLASGLYDADWISALRNYVNGLISPEKPLALWCSPDEKPWRVISCIYHVTSGYDAAFIPYPHPVLLWERLCSLNYENVRNDIERTVCTDFDFVHVLYRLSHQLPERFKDFLSVCQVLFIKRYEEWHERREALFNEYSTHDLFCYLTGWVLLQRALPEQFAGPGLYDTQNSPWLYRLPSAEYFV